MLDRDTDRDGVRDTEGFRDTCGDKDEDRNRKAFESEIMMLQEGGLWGD